MGDWLWNSSAEKVDEKMEWSVQLPRFLPELWSLNCPKKYIFCNFVLTSARNLSLLKQFTYTKLKVLITVFQILIWFIGVWATIHEISAIKSSKTMLTQQKFNKVLRFQTLNIFKTLSYSIINNNIFWKRVTRPLYVNYTYIHICKLL